MALVLRLCIVCKKISCEHACTQIDSLVYGLLTCMQMHRMHTMQNVNTFIEFFVYRPSCPDWFSMHIAMGLTCNVHFLQLNSGGVACSSTIA